LLTGDKNNINNNNVNDEFREKSAKIYQFNCCKKYFKIVSVNSRL